jgi:hypothetical protein
MSEQVVEAPKVTVGFERKVNLGSGSSAVASIYVQAPTAPETGDADVDASNRADAIQAAMFEAKVAVFDALGITFDVTIDGKAVEALEQLGGVEVTPAQEAKAVASASRPTTNAAPEGKDALWAELAANPGKWFDNRESKQKDTQPDFKRKGTGEGLWLKNRGKNMVPDGIVVPDASAF